MFGKKKRLINFWFKSSSKPSVCLVWWYNIKVQYLSMCDFALTQGHRGNNAWFIGADSRSTQKLRKKIYSLLKSSKILMFSQEDVRWRKRKSRDIQQKWLVYHTAWCLDKEIPSFGKRALDKTRLLFFLSFLPGVIAIPIHLWVMRTAGKPSRSLKPLTQKWKKGQSGLWGN